MKNVAWCDAYSYNIKTQAVKCGQCSGVEILVIFNRIVNFMTDWR
jgi:hypothetical protein